MLWLAACCVLALAGAWFAEALAQDAAPAAESGDSLAPDSAVTPDSGDSATSDDVTLPGDSDAPTLPPLVYEVSIEGDLPDHLRALLQQVSQLYALRGRPPITRAGLEGRIERDLQLLREALQSEGYYQSKIDWRIDDPVAAGAPLSVVLTVDKGPLFTIQHFGVDFPPAADLTGLKQPALAEVGILIGMPATSQAVLDAERRFVRYLQDNGYPNAAATGRKVTVDLATHAMNVTLKLDPGPLATFGPLAIEGNENVDPAYLDEVIDWPEGERYSAAKLEQARQRVAGMNLYNAVNLTTGDEPGPDGTLPATLTLTERPARTVGVGVSFTTAYGDKGLGLGGDAFWEHRNLLGKAEVLRIELALSAVEQRLTALFRKPRFYREDQSLLLSAEIHREDNDAYSEDAIQFFAGVERKLSRYLKIATGPSFEAISVQGQDPDTRDKNDQYLIYSLPTTLTWDSRNDPFNATKGVAAQALVTPSLATLADTALYTTVDLSGSTYYAPFGDDSVVLAARGRFGSILGGTLETVPVSKRFFSGGGGSVRGYDLYSIGPRDPDGDPTGGLSVVEFNLETRFRFYEDYGLALFLDAGQVYETRTPTFSEPLMYSAGIGLRYFTVIGPIRLDIATPLNPRSDDKPVQFYVSIGQAF